MPLVSSKTLTYQIKSLSITLGPGHDRHIFVRVNCSLKDPKLHV